MRAAVEHRQIAHHAEHGLLLGTYDMRIEHKFRGTTELRACSGRCHLRNRLASPDHRPCIGLEVRAGFDGDGFAGEHGLINLNRSLRQADVGGNHGPERQLHDVARHQLGGGQIRPDAIPPDRRRQRQPRLQGGKGCLGTPLLEESERGVEHQQTGDDRGPGILADAPSEARSRLRASREPATRIFPVPCEMDSESCPAPRWDRTASAGGRPPRS